MADRKRVLIGVMMFHDASLLGQCSGSASFGRSPRESPGVAPNVFLMIAYDGQARE